MATFTFYYDSASGQRHHLVEIECSICHQTIQISQTSFALRIGPEAFDIEARHEGCSGSGKSEE